MQIISVLVCVTLMSIIEAATVPKMSKLKLNLVNLNKSEIQETSTRKLPEERRKLALFPKSKKKFVVTPEPQQTVISNPTTRTTKKPLMKKIELRKDTLDFKNTVVEPETQRPVIKEVHLDDLPVDPKLKKEVIVHKSVEVIKDNSADSEEKNNSVPDEESQTAVYPAIEEIQDENSKEEDTAAFIENIRQKLLLLVDEVKFGDDDDQVADWREFMFLNPVKQGRDSSNEASEEFGTTTAAAISRVKRGDNIIAEENLGTTIAGYKFTWRDDRLTNNLIFKNIHA